MSNDPIHTVNFQAKAGYYPISLEPGVTMALDGERFTVTTPEGVMHFPRATPDPALALASSMVPALECPTAVHGVAADGIPTVTIPAGASVTLVNSRLQWVGKPGDAPPLNGLDGTFSEANRVEQP